MITNEQVKRIAKQMVAECWNGFGKKPLLRDAELLVRICYRDEPPERDDERWCDVAFIPMFDTRLYREQGRTYCRCLSWLNENHRRVWDEEKERWVAA